MPLFIVLTLNFLKLSVLNLTVVFSCLRYGIYFELGLIKAPEYVYKGRLKKTANFVIACGCLNGD